MEKKRLVQEKMQEEIKRKIAKQERITATEKMKRWSKVEREMMKKGRAIEEKKGRKGKDDSSEGRGFGGKSEGEKKK